MRACDFRNKGGNGIMIEVYSIFNQAAPGSDSGVIIGFAAFWGVVFLILLISFIKKIATGNVRAGRIVGNVLAMVFIIVFFAIIAIGAWSEKQMYNEYMEVWESGSYFVESGEPERLDFYPTEDDDGNTVYGATFWINEKYFDSYHAYGEGYFSKSDLKLIDSSKYFEVKYFVDENNDTIILSLSVSTDQRS